MSCLWITSLILWSAGLTFAWYVVYQVWMANDLYQQARIEQQRRLVEYAITVFHSSCPPPSASAYKAATQWVDECQQLNFVETIKFKQTHIEQEAVLAALGGGSHTCHSGVSYFTSVGCWAYAVLMHRGDVFPIAVLVATTLLFALLYVIIPHQLHRQFVAQWEKKLVGDAKRAVDYELVSSRGEGEIDVQMATAPSRQTPLRGWHTK